MLGPGGLKASTSIFAIIGSIEHSLSSVDLTPTATRIKHELSSGSLTDLCGQPIEESDALDVDDKINSRRQAYSSSKSRRKSSGSGRYKRPHSVVAPHPSTTTDITSTVQRISEEKDKSKSDNSTTHSKTPTKTPELSRHSSRSPSETPEVVKKCVTIEVGTISSESASDEDEVPASRGSDVREEMADKLSALKSDKMLPSVFSPSYTRRKVHED